MIHISFNTLNAYLNITDVNKLSANIITSKLFVNFCEYHKSRVLVYDELHNSKRIFNIIISNEDTFKNSDCHIFIHNRDIYYKERTVLANT